MHDTVAYLVLTVLSKATVFWYLGILAIKFTKL